MTKAWPWIIALMVSILVNGILGGYLINRATDDGPRHVRMRGVDGGGGGFDLRRFVQALPEAERRRAIRRLRENLPENRELMDRMMAARQSVSEALRAEPFDADRVAAALGELRDVRAERERRVEAGLLDVLDGLDAETRADVLEAAGRPLPDGPPHFRDRRGPPPHRRDGPGRD
ncbi:periplasmic heavy metal sensor [Maricaulis sp. D1M11]|uniref:periplasmic heavy metal sensor n=1 Tax=Maricaulis sp. D1M11 TaxID=3076117 RepID=UPI0039B5BB65